MGRIETQIEAKNKVFIGCLTWYIHAMDTLNRSHARAVNDLNHAFNERMSEIKAEIEPKKRKKKSADKDSKPKEEQ